MKQMVGYVRQNNVLRDSDTVYMTLRSLAQTRLPKELTVSEELLHSIIMTVLRELSIDGVADTLVGKLSGGQKRRLCIAAEYVYAPPLFFLDEPDSGLDPITAKELMTTLRTIADKGKIVIVITHTPDRTPELFDKVLVLAKSTQNDCGRTAFFGTVDETLRFFNTDSFEGVEQLINNNPDYYIEKYEREKN